MEVYMHIFIYTYVFGRKETNCQSQIGGIMDKFYLIFSFCLVKMCIAFIILKNDCRAFKLQRLWSELVFKGYWVNTGSALC